MLLDRAETVRKIADSVHLLGLKFGMTGNLFVVEHMLGIMEETVRIEEEYFPAFLADLRRVTEEGRISKLF